MEANRGAPFRAVRASQGAQEDEAQGRQEAPDEAQVSVKVLFWSLKHLKIEFK